MADISDVLTSLGQLIGATLYPTTPSDPEASSPVAGVPVLVASGWPDPATLDRDLAAGKAHVTVYAQPRGRNTTRYEPRRVELPIPATTYTLTQAGQTITVGGAAPATYSPQNLAVFVGGKPYVIQALTGQGAIDVAAALFAAIVVDYPAASVAGPTITLPASARIGALRVGATGATVREARRQEVTLQVIVWAPTPTIRDAVASAIDVALADTHWLALPDHTSARLLYQHTIPSDFSQKQGVYRRDLIFTAEYATTITERAPQMVAGVTDEIVPGGDTFTTYS